MSENSDITRPLVAAIRQLPWCMAHRLHAGSVPTRGGRMQLEPIGTPDVIALLRRDAEHPAHVVYFETKSPGGRLTDRQQTTHNWLRAFGHRVEVPRSLAEAMKTVREILEARR